MQCQCCVTFDNFNRILAAHVPHELGTRKCHTIWKLEEGMCVVMIAKQTESNERKTNNQSLTFIFKWTCCTVINYNMLFCFQLSITGNCECTNVILKKIKALFLDAWNEIMKNWNVINNYQYCFFLPVEHI